MTREVEIELARKFFDHIYFNEIEYGEDVIYEFIDPECEHEDICDRLNNETVKEVIAIGFKQKYGVDWQTERKAVANADNAQEDD